MAVTKTHDDGILRANIVQDTDADTTSEDAARNQACTLYSIDANNAVAAAEYIKLYDDLNPTVGTTEPTMIIGPLPNSTRVVSTIVGGYDFANGISLVGSDTAGKAAGTNPTSNINVNLITD